jgi:cytochrome c biogenesis protein CcdA/thiol-disulfide isomerase/thioredoxin
MRNNLPIMLLALFAAILVLSAGVSGTESCTSENSSACQLQDGSLTLNPLETDAFLSAANDQVCIVYFYSNSCSHCTALKPFISEIEAKYGSQIRLTRYEVSDPENLKLYQQLCSLRNYNGQSIPLIGINDRILVGENIIRNELEDEIEKALLMAEKTCPLGGEQCHLVNGSEDNSSAEPPIKGLTDLKFSTVFPIIALAGLSDGVNPCAFVILIFIVVFLQEISGSKKRIVRVTAAYIISFLIVNVIIGIIYYFISQKIGFPQIIRYIVIAISVAAGLINIKDFFWYGKGISLGIPKSAKGYLMNLVHLASVPAALVLGAAVAVLEAPCSIPIYLSVIEVLKGAGRPLGAVLPFILVYNLFFILPLIVVSLLAYKGHDLKLFEEKSLAAKRYMKLVIGIVLLLLALAFIKGWF